MYRNQKIVVIILNYNDASTTINLLENIKNYKTLDLIIVVDNKSGDNSYEELLKKQTEKVVVIQSDRNGGYAYGNNYGAKKSIELTEPDIIFIANPDVIFTESFIKKIVDDLIDFDIDACTGVMNDKEGNNQNEYLKINNYFEDVVNCTLLIKKLIGKKIVKYTGNKLVYTEYLPGSLFAMTSNSFKTVKGFDDNTFLYCEERILGKKFKNYHLKMGIDTSTSFIHNHSVTIRKSLDKVSQTKALYKSIMYYYKNYTDIGVFRLLVLKLMMIYGIEIRKLTAKILAVYDDLFNYIVLSRKN